MTGPIRGEKSLFLLWQELSLSIVCNVALLLVMDLGGHASMKNCEKFANNRNFGVAATWTIFI